MAAATGTARPGAGWVWVRERCADGARRPVGACPGARGCSRCGRWSRWHAPPPPLLRGAARPPVSVAVLLPPPTQKMEGKRGAGRARSPGGRQLPLLQPRAPLSQRTGQWLCRKGAEITWEVELDDKQRRGQP